MKEKYLLELTIDREALLYLHEMWRGTICISQQDYRKLKQFNDEGIFAAEKQPDIVQRFWDSNGAVQHFDKLLNVSGFQFSLFKTEPIKQSTGMNWQSLSV